MLWTVPSIVYEYSHLSYPDFVAVCGSRGGGASVGSAAALLMVLRARSCSSLIHPLFIVIRLRFHDQVCPEGLWLITRYRRLTQRRLRVRQRPKRICASAMGALRWEFGRMVGVSGRRWLSSSHTSPVLTLTDYETTIESGSVCLPVGDIRQLDRIERNSQELELSALSSVRVQSDMARDGLGISDAIEKHDERQNHPWLSSGISHTPLIYVARVPLQPHPFSDLLPLALKARDSLHSTNTPV